MFDHLEPEWPSDPSGDGEPRTTVIFSAKLRRASSSTAFQPGRPHGRKNRRLPRLWISQDENNIRTKQNHSPSHISPPHPTSIPVFLYKSHQITTPQFHFPQPAPLRRVYDLGNNNKQHTTDGGKRSNHLRNFHVIWCCVFGWTAIATQRV